jgi:phosphoglycolate phosphatase-like HAD superfamily hydrolase
MKSVVIFDFDGTIADTFVMQVNIFYKLKPRWPILPKGEIERLRGMAVLQVARELQIPVWQMPFLLMRGRRIMADNIGGVSIIPGMDEAIKQLHAEGHKLYVISTNSKENVNRFLERYDLLKYFTDVYGTSGLLPINKARVIKRLMRAIDSKPKSAYYVGDDVRDIIAARKAAVHSIAVSWGFNNIKVLSEHKPNVMVFDPAEIIKIVR